MFNQYALDVATALRAINDERVREVVEILRKAKYQNANVWIVGNGGSLATASHLANDLLKMAGVHAISISDLIPTVTAFGNDEGWENMFATPLSKFLLPMDVLIAISCSGNSKNVVEAVRMVKTHRLAALRVVVLTGADMNSEISKLQPDVIVYVPFKDIRVQEDCHSVICHAIAGALANNG